MGQLVQAPWVRTLLSIVGPQGPGPPADMAGIVHFKFKSQISYDSVSFDGHFVSIGELKNLIAEKRGIGRDASAELTLIDPQTQATYTDDAALVPKSSSVLVKRTPQARHAALQGASAPQAVAVVGQAARTGTPPAGAPAAGRDAAERGGELYGEAAAPARGAAAADEDAALDSMLRAAGSNWQREVAAGSHGRGRGGRGMGRGRAAVDPDYTCKRCGQRGHWISNCPTNGDPAFDRKVVPDGHPDDAPGPRGGRQAAAAQRRGGLAGAQRGRVCARNGRSRACCSARRPPPTARSQPRRCRSSRRCARAQRSRARRRRCRQRRRRSGPAALLRRLRQAPRRAEQARRGWQRWRWQAARAGGGGCT